jgi:hypothetical protein
MSKSLKIAIVVIVIIILVAVGWMYFGKGTFKNISTVFGAFDQATSTPKTPLENINSLIGIINKNIDRTTALETKLQADIDTAKADGKDTKAMEASLTDLKSKVADASAQVQKASDLVSGLSEDSGDATVKASNMEAISKAHALIKGIMQDIIAARKDSSTIITETK